MTAEGLLRLLGAVAGASPVVVLVIVAGLVVADLLRLAAGCVLALLRPNHDIKLTRSGVDIRPHAPDERLTSDGTGESHDDGHQAARDPEPS